MSHLPANFLGATLSSVEPAQIVVISWLRPDLVHIAAHARTAEAVLMFGRDWSGAPADAGQAQIALGRAVAEPEALGEGVRLELQLGGSPHGQHEWAPDTATPALAAAQAELERIAHRHYLEADTWLNAGRARLAKGDTKRAVTAFQRGIAIMGRRHRHPSVIDDSGAKLAEAEFALESGEEQRGAALLERVLETRLNIYAKLKLQAP
ncbi:MAG: hypothetical protein KF778_05980 [Rhodocyclaceae bacterium]|nr:hypothetical protein [Rhodocyclaceae bacterium]